MLYYKENIFMSEIYYGRGNKDQYDEYMELINHVFSDDNERYFQELLPKLYKPESNPAYNAFVAIEDGKMIAGIGDFPCEMVVCGKSIWGAGIGNVAVHKDHRRRGLMIKLLNDAIDDMVANEIDISFLGGQRQRYNHFSYDVGGATYSFRVESKNIKYVYGDDSTIKYQITDTELDRDDNESLDEIARLLASHPYYHVRERSNLYDIMCTWHSKPHVFKCDGKFVGYYVKGGSVSEIDVIDDEYFADAIRAMIKANGSVNISIAPFQTSFIKVLEPLCDGYNISSNAMYTVLCYRRVIDAFLSLKATYTNLVDGKITVLVHGRGGDELFTVEVKDNKVSATITNDEPDMELTHMEAMNMFFGNVSLLRGKAPAVVSQWFPLPLWIYNVDDV